MTQSRLQSGQFWLICLLLAGVTVGVYWPVTRYEFITFDDPDYVTKNGIVQAGLTGAGLIWAFTTYQASNWHPVTWLTHMLDCQVHGLDAGGHHFTNLLLHAANAVLLFVVLRGLTGAMGRSAFVAALFAWHPLHVESVAWVSERKEVLSTLFGLLTLWSYARYAQKESKVEGRGSRDGAGVAAINPQRSILYYGLALLFFALGLMSKPMLVTLPFLLLLLDYWPLGRLERSTFWGLVREKLPFFALSGLSSWITFVAQARWESVAPLASITMSDRAANAIVASAWYVVKLFWPAKLAVLYPLPASQPVAQVAGAAVLIGGITLLILWFGNRKPWALVAWLWFLGTLVPVIGLVQVGFQAYADRYTYVPYIGLFVILAWGVPELAARWPGRRAALTAGTVLALAGCLAGTRFQLRFWKNSATLFERTLQVTSHNDVAWYTLGIYFDEHGRWDRAIACYGEALEINPHYDKCWNNAGLALANQHEFTAAVNSLEQAVRIRPKAAVYRSNLASVLRDAGKPDEAVEELKEAIRLEPDYPIAYYNLGETLAAQGRMEEAVVQYGKALRLKPDFVEALNNLAWIRATDANAALRNGGEAVQLAERACRLTRDGDALYLGTLAAAYAEAGRFDEAVGAAQKARQLAQSNGRREIAERNEQLLEYYRAGRAYHLPAPPPAKGSKE